MEDRELDIVEMEGDDGSVVQLAVEKYFYYNGDEYVLLSDLPECEEGDEISYFVMKVVPLPEEGEDMEEFVPVDDDLMERLVEAAMTVIPVDDGEDDGEEE